MLIHVGKFFFRGDTNRVRRFLRNSDIRGYFFGHTYIWCDSRGLTICQIGSGNDRVDVKLQEFCFFVFLSPHFKLTKRISLDDFWKKKTNFREGFYGNWIFLWWFIWHGSCKMFQKFLKEFEEYFIYVKKKN